MALPLKAVLRATFGTVLVLYPFWAWYGLSHWGPAAVAAGLAAVTFCRALVTRSREDWVLSVIAVCLCAAAAFSGLEELELSYAITIHKSQGSEYPAVILPLLGGPRMLFNRNLLYTGITRARNCVTILGSSETVRNMIDNVSENRRYTALEQRIREVCDLPEICCLREET